MEDFNEFSKNYGASDEEGDVFKKVSDIAKKFDGKGTDDLLKAIYDETLKGKRAGTLSNDDIDRFAMMISPMLDDKKRKLLEKVVRELKKI